MPETEGLLELDDNEVVAAAVMLTLVAADVYSPMDKSLGGSHPEFPPARYGAVMKFGTPAPSLTVCGLDLGRRQDYSACVVLRIERRRLVVTHAFRLEQTAYREQSAAIAPILERAHRIADDRSGVGDPIGELLPKDAVPILITGGNTVDLVYGCWHYPKTKLITNLLELAPAVSSSSPVAPVATTLSASYKTSASCPDCGGASA